MTRPSEHPTYLGRGPSGEVDIARNIQAIERLRTDLLSLVAALGRAMLKGAMDQILDALAGIIITVYLLGRRLGISFSRLEARLGEKLAEHTGDPLELEQRYGDITALKTYIDDRPRSL